MATDLALDVETRTHMEDISIDQEGEWDLSLFDDLGESSDADDLLRALGAVSYDGNAPEMDFDIDLSVWSPGACSTCTDTDGTLGSLSPMPSVSPASSPTYVDAPSPFSLQGEALSSPASICSDSGSSSDVVQERRTQRKSNVTSRVSSSQSVKRPINVTPKMTIQPKPVMSVPMAHATAAFQPSTIIIQPLQTMLPVEKVTPVTIHPAPAAAHPLLLTPSARVVPLRSPQIIPPVPVVKLAGPLTVPSLHQERPVITVTLPNTPATDGDSASRRQQRMMKNRESASLSRKKKKEYLLTLESRLKLALSENQQLKTENGSLKMQLDGLINENNILKVTAPKRRAVCLMVVVMFVLVNVGPLSMFERDSAPVSASGAAYSGRHLLGFSDGKDAGVVEQPESSRLDTSDGWVDSKEKALMVVKKDQLLFGPPPPCQPTFNRTKSIRMAHELRGWVHRHEVERTKARRLSGSQQKTKAILKPPGEKAEVSRIVTVQYTDVPEENPGRELQVYYARNGYYNDFFEEIHRRGDTFYVVSFRRDHLLLPATSHNKGSRPKMSVVLPAMNVNDTVIRDEEYEVMMQIDCEVMDTRILRVKASSIPPFLRHNRSDPYQAAHAGAHTPSPVGVLTGSS